MNLDVDDIFEENIKNDIDKYYEHVNVLKVESLNKDILILRLCKLRVMIMYCRVGDMSYIEKSAFSIKNIMEGTYTKITSIEIDNLNVILEKIKYLIFGDNRHLDHSLLLLNNLIKSLDQK